MVYVVVLLGFITALYLTFVTALRYLQMQQARADALDASQLCVNMLNRELSSGAISSLQTQAQSGSQVPALLFLSAQPAGTVFTTDLAGSLLWQAWICFHLDTQTNSLMMVTENIVPTPVIPASPGFAAMTALPSRVVARNVKSINFTLSGTILSYQLTTQALASTAGQPPSGVTVSGHFVMRN
jgi:hypothetical protein